MKCMLPGCARTRAALRRTAAVVLALWALPAAASPPLWELNLDGNLVRIAGSLHYLREDDYPLPGMVRCAYAEADTLVLEYDAARQGRPVDPAVLTRRVPRAGRMQPAGELRRFLSTPEFTALRRLARERDYDVERLDDLRPWFAGLYVIDRELGEAGFRSDLGLDEKLLEWARDDGKPVVSLESRSDRRRLFESIPMEDQVDFLIQSLRDAPRMGPAMTRVVDSWREGDLEQLERRLLTNLRRRPEEYQRFAVERNRQWLDRLLDLPGDGGDYLVAVGVMHVLGDDSLIAMLRDRGFDVRRMERADESGDCRSRLRQGR